MGAEVEVRYEIAYQADNVPGEQTISVLASSDEDAVLRVGQKVGRVNPHAKLRLVRIRSERDEWPG